jgi:hypothetical protein
MNLLRERQRAYGAHRLCGGDSDSSQTTQQFDKRVTGRDGAQVSGDGNTVNIMATDQGSVFAGAEAQRGAFELVKDSNRTTAALTMGVFGASAALADESLRRQSDVFGAALANTKGTFSTAIASIDKAYETAKAGDQREVSMVAMAVVGIVAAVTLFGKARA